MRRERRRAEPERANDQPFRQEGPRTSSSGSRSTTLVFRFQPAWPIHPRVSEHRNPPPQPGNPRSRVHLVIIAEGAGSAARCPLNRSSTTSAPPPRNYESLRAGFHRGNTHTRGEDHIPDSPGITRQSAWALFTGDRVGEVLDSLPIFGIMTIMKITTAAVAAAAATTATDPQRNSLGSQQFVKLAAVPTA